MCENSSMSTEDFAKQTEDSAVKAGGTVEDREATFEEAVFISDMLHAGMNPNDAISRAVAKAGEALGMGPVKNSQDVVGVAAGGLTMGATLSLLGNAFNMLEEARPGTVKPTDFYAGQGVSPNEAKAATGPGTGRDTGSLGSSGEDRVSQAIERLNASLGGTPPSAPTSSTAPVAASASASKGTANRPRIGTGSTILTSAQGLLSPVSTAKKTLLGL